MPQQIQQHVGPARVSEVLWVLAWLCSSAQLNQTAPAGACPASACRSVVRLGALALQRIGDRAGFVPDCLAVPQKAALSSLKVFFLISMMNCSRLVMRGPHLT